MTNLHLHYTIHSGVETYGNDISTCPLLWSNDLIGQSNLERSGGSSVIGETLGVDSQKFHMEPNFQSENELVDWNETEKWSLIIAPIGQSNPCLIQ